jgi:hypothetical protein
LLLGGDIALAKQRNRKPPLTAENVRTAIDRGVQFLRQSHNARSGRFGSVPEYQEGSDALCVLALLNCDVSPDDPMLRVSLERLESVPDNKLSTYFVSLRIMALATADPLGKRYLAQVTSDTKWLVNRQVTRGPHAGGWDYSRPKSSADASNSQFALLALHEAAKLGVAVPNETWEQAKKYWLAVSGRDGGFLYRVGGTSSTGSMTCAGISSLIIINENLNDGRELPRGDVADCCADSGRSERVESALRWMADKFSVRSNPGRANYHQLYYLYGMERAGRLAGVRFFGAHDWYRSGAEELLRQHDRNPLAGGWRGSGHAETHEEIATSLALLFLSKGKRSIAVGKAKWADDDRWDKHPKGVHYLTRRLEKVWEQRLNWQTVRTKDASTDDLLEAPVLFFSGRQALELSAREKENLKEYLNNGGFVFAEACQGEGCGDGAFHDSFVALMQEVLPESQLELLPPNHPIWGAQYPLVPDTERPLYGLQSCCRTSVVYCPANLSCYWSLDRKSIDVSPRLQQRIESCVQIGVNVVTYATGRELKDKGDTPTLATRSKDLLAGRTLVLPKLTHGGGDDDAPNAWRNVLENVRASPGLRVETEKRMIAPTVEELAEHPFVFMHGRSDFQFTEAERKALRVYLDAGGFIFADAICSSPEFARAFRREMQLIVGQRLASIPADHPMWRDQRFGSQIESVTLRTRDPNRRDGFRSETTAPQLESITIDDEIRVVFSPYDLSCAMESPISQCDGYTREDATRIATNVIMYRLLSD